MRHKKKPPRIIGLIKSNTIEALHAETEQENNLDWLFSSVLFCTEDSSDQRVREIFFAKSNIFYRQ
jgi:hypothetical protein